MDINAINTTAPRPTGAGGGVNDLTSDDFLRLLVTQLSQQDPLQPTSNEAILQQLSAIRDIQASTSLSESLHTLTNNQRFGAAASLIGKHVNGKIVDEQGETRELSGVVSSIRFDADGRTLLELDSGDSLPLEELESVGDHNDPLAALIGRHVQGHDPADSSGDRLIEGMVTAVRRDPAGEASLELDTGESLPISDLLAAA